MIQFGCVKIFIVLRTELCANQCLKCLAQDAIPWKLSEEMFLLHHLYPWTCFPNVYSQLLYMECDIFAQNMNLCAALKQYFGDHMCFFVK